MIEKNKIYNEDCLDTMKKIPDKYIDAIITSPPYNMNLRIRNGEYCYRQSIKGLSLKYDDFKDNLPIDEFYAMHKLRIKEMLRVSKIVFYNFQIVTGSKRAFFKIIGDFNEQVKDIIIWDKINAEPAIQEGVMNSQYENIIILGDNPISRQFSINNWERGTLSNVWKIKKNQKRNKKHRAIFPEELIKKIINNFTKENDLIYDPFIGVGTTAVVSKKLNRNFIGSELIQTYCEIANKKINNILF